MLQKKNKYNLALIILSAFFTVLAYISDQIVLRKENYDRIMSSDNQILELDIHKSENYRQRIESLASFGKQTFLYNLKKNNFILKNLILTSSEFLDDDIKKNNIKTLTNDNDYFIRETKSQQVFSVNRLINLVYQIVYEYEMIFVYEKENGFTEIKNLKFELDSKPRNHEKIFNENKNKFYFYKDFNSLNKTLDLEDNYREELDKNNLYKTMDLRNFKLLILENLLKDIKYMHSITKELEKAIDLKIKNRDTQLENIRKNKHTINIFILIGISSQILTLFFLLLFFKSLLKQGLRI